MATYRLGENIVRDAGDEEHQALLGAFHQFGGRPMCLCKPDGVEMYIAKIETGVYVIKRMPNSAQGHNSNCDHFEIPAGLSGLSQVMGSAIQENQVDQCIDLKFDFALSKTGKRAPIAGSGAEKDSVVANPNRLTLRGLLHYLWEEAGFNRWVPKMAGRRNWFVIRKHLLAAAEGKRSSAGSLADLLYMPEAYDEINHKAIAQRRLSLLARAAQSTSKGQKLILAVGVLDRIDMGGSGHRMFLQHAPDFPMLIADDLHRRLMKRFHIEFGLSDYFEHARMMVIATVWVDTSGVSRVDQMSVMMVSPNWIPFESSFESSLFEELTAKNRYFIRGMRYNLTSEKVLASCMLTDCLPPVAMLINASAEGETQAAPEIPFALWTWEVAKESMPSFPVANLSAPSLAR